MTDVLIERGQLQAMFSCEACEIFVSDLIGFPRAAFKGGKIIGYSLSASLRGEFFQKIPCVLHAKTNGRSGVAADPEEAEFGKRAQNNLPAGKPTLNLGMF